MGRFIRRARPPCDVMLQYMRAVLLVWIVEIAMLLLFLSSLLISIVACAALLGVGRQLGAFTKPRNDAVAVQCSHIGNPLRVGGIAVIFGLVVATGFFGITQSSTIAPLLLLSLLPVFLTGLAEDLGQRVSPCARIVAAAFSAMLAVALFGVWLPRGDIPVVDQAMSFPLVAIILTVTFSTGFCHAVNLVDGMNGLAASVVTTSALGCAAVATLAAQSELASLSLLLAAVTTGFLLFNWPVARLFLGDAGAYGLGHMLSWLTVLLAWNASEVAIPALALIIFWPLADVVHTILRRLAVQASIVQPDRMHLHQKVRRALDILWFGYNRRRCSNPLTTLVLLPFIATPVITGVLLWDKPGAAWFALGVFSSIFAAAHPLTTRHAKLQRRVQSRRFEAVAVARASSSSLSSIAQGSALVGQIRADHPPVR